jgi:hypothetical protein
MKRLLIVALAAALALPGLAAAQDLVLRRVMLSSGGLGYFEYEASVEGDAVLKLTVALEQVDDVLKSLVVYDDKGGVGGLSLPGREPLKQAFKDLPFDESALSSPATLLATLKGAQISVGGGRAMSGRVVSVEPESAAINDGKTTIRRTRVTLLTDRGLQQFILEDAENLQFADAALRDKIGQALMAIQSNRTREARTIDLSARGQGKRTVRVAYIVEAPVWKASYRLTLPGDNAPRAGLQGWATVENLSGQDWKNVELTLASGRPVAFHQALYEAYYVTRPEIPVEVAGRLMPNVDRGGVRAEAAPPPPAPAPLPSNQKSMFQERSASAPAMMPPPATAGAADQFEATEAATQVVFKFPRPVSVENGRTLSIPILDRQVPASRLALYQPDAASRNPLAAVRLTNDGDTGLPPGILTIYEAYALDEKIVIEREDGRTERLAAGTIVNGVLRYSRLVRQTTTYRVRGPAKEPRQLVVVQRRLQGWSLVKPDGKGVEISEGNYRLPFQLPGGDQPQTIEVVQEQTQQQDMRLLDGPADQIRVFAQAQEFDARTREALSKVLQLQAGVSEAQRKVGELDGQRKAIADEQARLRENLARVPANSDLQRRYLATLDKQETELEAIAARRIDAEKAVEAARTALRNFVASLG